MVNVAVQLALAMFLFFAVNWIGEHSSTFGYLQLSLVPRSDSAPAFNFFLKALAPTAYIILVATAFYVFKWSGLVERIWLVAAYYFAFRILFNILLGRAPILNWVSTLTQASVGIGAAYLAYVHLILPRHPLFPGVESIGNQLWIIIALFLYAVFNHIQVSSKRTVRKKNKYLLMRFEVLNKQYGQLIDGQYPERYMELVAYAILIYETFNRPRVAQLFERMIFPWGSHTLGPMQVRTSKRISDWESVVLGAEYLRVAFETTEAELAGKNVSRYEIIRTALAKYNRDEHYIAEIFNLLHILWAQVATNYRIEFETMHVRPALVK
jgi:hypothetical protein